RHEVGGCPRAALSIEMLEPRTLLTTSSSAFVTQIYHDLLHRDPDPGGLNAFVSLLDQGQASRQQVAQLFTASLEYHVDLVASLYTQLLHRPVDAAGLPAWLAFLNQGNT